MQLFCSNRIPSLRVQLHRFARFATCAAYCVETSMFSRFLKGPTGHRFFVWRDVRPEEEYVVANRGWTRIHGIVEAPPPVPRNGAVERSKIDRMDAFCAAQMLLESSLLSIRYSLRYSPKHRRRYGESRRRVKMGRSRFNGIRSKQKGYRPSEARIRKPTARLGTRKRTRKGANGLPFDFKHLFRMQATAEDVEVSSPRVFVCSRRIRMGRASAFLCVSLGLIALTAAS